MTPLPSNTHRRDDAEPAVGPADAAELLGVTTRTLRRMKARGDIRAIETDGTPLYPASAVVEAFIDRARHAADPRDSRRSTPTTSFHRIHE